MQKALIGAGGCARDIKAHMQQDLPCFVDDAFYNRNTKNTYPLSQFNFEKYEVLVALGDSQERMNIVNRLPDNTQYFSFIHPSAQILDKNIEIGKGAFISANCILTTNIVIGNHCQLNISSTISHDCIIGDYFTTAPGARVCGSCHISDCVYLGANSCVKQKINICSNVIVGLNAGVVKDIFKEGVYVGTPAKLL